MKKKLLKIASVLLALTVFLLLFAGCQTAPATDGSLSDEGAFTLATTAASTTAKTKATTKPTTRKTAKTTAKKTTTVPTTAATTVNAKEYAAYEHLKNAMEITSALKEVNLDFEVQTERRKDINDPGHVQMVGLPSRYDFDYEMQIESRDVGGKYAEAHLTTDSLEWYSDSEGWVYIPADGYGVKYKPEEEETNWLGDFLKLPSKQYLKDVPIKKKRAGTDWIIFTVEKQDVESIYGTTIEYIKNGMTSKGGTIKECTVGEASLEYDIDENGYVVGASIEMDMYVIIAEELPNTFTGEITEQETTMDTRVLCKWRISQPGQPVDFTLPEGREEYIEIPFDETA